MSHLTTKEIVDLICIIMFILGTLGNSLGLIVFSSRKFRRTTYGRLAIASLIINLLCVYRYSLLLHSDTRRWITYKAGESWFNCKLYRLSSCLRFLSAFVTVAWTYERFTYVTTNFHFFQNNQFIKKYKFYFMIILSLIIITTLTGPTVHFYQSKSIFINNPQIKSHQNTTSTNNHRLINSSLIEEYFRENETITNNDQSYQMTCGLKESISLFWYSFLIDVGFGLNYTTFRSIFSEIIPSILVIIFNIGIIIRVIQSRLSFLSKKSSRNSRQIINNSFQSKDGLIIHNRPRTSWMNIVLIIHSSTFVHWSTSNALLSYWTSVVILANYSLNFYVYCLSGKSFRNEIKKLFNDYLDFYCYGTFLNLFRTKSQRQQVRQTVRMRLIRQRSTNLQSQIIHQKHRSSLNQRYN